MTLTATRAGSAWWISAGPVAGGVLAFVDSLVNRVPIWLGEVGTARAERSGWSQTAEFASLILNAGWAWAAAATFAGWWVSRSVGTRDGLRRGLVAGTLALISATTVYYVMNAVFTGDGWWGSATEYWLIGSLLFGPALGAIGALTRRRGWIGVLAGLTVPAGSALQMVLLPPPAESLMALPVRWTVCIVAAAAAVLVLRTNARTRSQRTNTGAQD
jgi:hypothetical protein